MSTYTNVDIAEFRARKAHRDNSLIPLLKDNLSGDSRDGFLEFTPLFSNQAGTVTPGSFLPQSGLLL